MLTFVLCFGPDVESERSSDREGHSCHSIAYDPVCVDYAFLLNVSAYQEEKVFR